MYCIGDKVVCPLHGAGIIENIITRSTSTVDTEFFVVRLLSIGLKITIPTSSMENSGIRYIITKKNAKNLVDTFHSLNFEYDSNWTKRYRDNMERLKTGDILEVAKVYKSLAERNKIKGLSAGERKMYQLAKQILFSELMLSLDCEKCDIEDYLSINIELDEEI